MNNKLIYKYGWYNLSNKAKHIIGNNNIDCYICDELNYVKDLKCCKILKDIKYRNNIYVVCNKCFNNNKLVKSPKTFNDILEFTKKKNKIYKSQFTINKLLEYDYETLKQCEVKLLTNIYNKKSCINELKDINAKLDKTRDIEIERNKILRIHYDNNVKIKLDLVNKSIEARKRFKDDLNHIVYYMTKTYQEIYNGYDNIIKKTEEDGNRILELCENAISPECKICYNNQVEYCITPCNHCICAKCYLKLEKDEDNEKKCPYCNTQIDYPHRIYLN